MDIESCMSRLDAAVDVAMVGLVNIPRKDVRNYTERLLVEASKNSHSITLTTLDVAFLRPVFHAMALCGVESQPDIARLNGDCTTSWRGRCRLSAVQRTVPELCQDESWCLDNEKRLLRVCSILSFLLELQRLMKEFSE